MFLRSRSLAGSTLSVPAVLAHSLPAKSTRCSLPVHSMTEPSAETIFFECTLRVNKQWEREDCLFILVSPTCRRSCARCMRLNTSAGVFTGACTRRATALVNSARSKQGMARRAGARGRGRGARRRENSAPDLGEVVHKEPLSARLVVLADLQLDLVLGVLDEQVRELLVVDLEVARRNLGVAVLGVREVVKDGLRRARDHALALLAAQVALHRVRLARARLAVGEHGALEAAEHVWDDGLDRLLEHLLLRRERAEHVVKVVRRALLAVARALDDDHLLFLGARRHDRQRVPLLLALVERAHAHDDLHRGALHLCGHG